LNRHGDLSCAGSRRQAALAELLDAGLQLGRAPACRADTLDGSSDLVPQLLELVELANDLGVERSEGLGGGRWNKVACLLAQNVCIERAKARVSPRQLESMMGLSGTSVTLDRMVEVRLDRRCRRLRVSRVLPELVRQHQKSDRDEAQDGQAQHSLG
jgi:hypothetical protein